MRIKKFDQICAIMFWSNKQTNNCIFRLDENRFFNNVLPYLKMSYKIVCIIKQLED